MSEETEEEIAEERDFTLVLNTKDLTVVSGCMELTHAGLGDIDPENKDMVYDVYNKILGQIQDQLS